MFSHVVFIFYYIYIYIYKYLTNYIYLSISIYLYLYRVDLLNFLRERGADITAHDHSNRSAHDISTFHGQAQVAALVGQDSPSQRFRSRA